MRVRESLAIRQREIGDGAEVGVVAVAFAGEHRVQRVVEVVVPLRVAADAVRVLRGDEAGVVRRALRDHRTWRRTPIAASACTASVSCSTNGYARRIGDRVHGVEPQRVDVEVVDPLERVVDEVPADLVAARRRRSSGPRPTACGTGR